MLDLNEGRGDGCCAISTADAAATAQIDAA